MALIDANALVVIVDRDSPDHMAVLRIVEDASIRIIIPALCIAEATYLIERDYGPIAEAAFLEGLRDFEVIAPERDDWVRIAELVRRYANFPIGGADASVIALAERINVDTVITFDRRHFAAVRPRHCERFRLLPEPR